MKVLIIEDEQLAADRLERQLEECSTDISVLRILSSVRESIEWLKTNPLPDLIFLDIQLSDGHAFDILDNFKVKSPIVFTTAFDQYAIRAFRHHGIAYLLKPFQVSDIEAALSKLSEINYRQEQGLDLSKVIEELSDQLKPSFKERFFVKVKDEAFSVSVKEVALFNHEDGIVLLYQTDKQRFHVKFSLDQLESLLDPKVFFRINRKQIVSINHLTKIDTSVSGRVYLEVNCPRIEQPLTVSKHRTHEFRTWLDT